MAEPILPPRDELPRLVITPGSVTWRHASDARALLGAGAALVLQVAHPTVAAGVREHSDFQRDPWGRLLRTLDFVNTLVYGGPDRAAAIGRGVREMHKSIKGTAPDGTRYHALEPEAYAWVHATLALTIIGAHRTFGRRMTEAQVHVFWAQWRTAGRLLGVRDRDLPATWPDFLRYVDATVRDRLGDNDVVQDVLGVIASPAAPPLPGVTPGAWRVASAPASRVLELATIALLPDALRERVGLRPTLRQEAEIRLLSRATRAATPFMPRGLRATGPVYLRARGDEVWAGSRLPGTREPVALAEATAA